MAYDKDRNLIDRREMLRVKIKSLVAESQIIRKDAGKAHRRGNLQIFNELTTHRKVQLRISARHTSLALGFLKGRTYKEMEPKSADYPDWKAVHRMLTQYGTPLFKDVLDEFVTRNGITPDWSKLPEALDAFNEQQRHDRALAEHSRLSQELQTI